MAQLDTQLFIQNPEYFFSLLFLSIARVYPIINMVPFLGGKVMPIPAKMGLALSIFAITFPFMVESYEPIPWSPLLIGYVLKELFIGFILGFLASIPFTIAQMTGVVIDNQRGSSSLTGQDATTGSQSSSIGILYNYILIVIFFSLDGPFIFFDVLFKSYKMFPAEQFLPTSLFLSGITPFWENLFSVIGKAFMLSTQLAAPALVTILMTDTFLGIINRLAPQVQISFLGQGLKAFLGDLAIYFAWFFLLEQLGKMAISWTQAIGNHF
jgi:type III secretory pathway component EscT